MANLIGNPTIGLSVTLELDEREARALRLIAAWKNESIIGALASVIPSAELQENREALESFLDGCKRDLPLQLLRVDMARKAFAEAVGTPRAKP